MNTPAKTVGLACPYHVRTTGGTFHSGYDSEAMAEAAALAANAKAELLGIETRYSAAPNPKGSE